MGQQQHQHKGSQDRAGQRGSSNPSASAGGGLRPGGRGALHAGRKHRFSEARPHVTTRAPLARSTGNKAMPPADERGHSPPSCRCFTGTLLVDLQRKRTSQGPTEPKGGTQRESSLNPPWGFCSLQKFGFFSIPYQCFWLFVSSCEGLRRRWPQQRPKAPHTHTKQRQRVHFCLCLLSLKDGPAGQPGQPQG